MFWSLFFTLVLIRCISVKTTIISVRQKNYFYASTFPNPFSKWQKFFLDMRKDFPIMSDFLLVEILSEPNGLTIVTSKKILKMSHHMFIVSIFFLITRIRNSQCKILVWFERLYTVLIKLFYFLVKIDQ